MVDPIPAGVREAWEEWKIKGSILASLYIQTVLVLLAPFRKRTGHRLVIALVWSFYLLADGVALFALGQIFNVEEDAGAGSGGNGKKKENEAAAGDLEVLWSTFLLVHLGGPDAITAFSIADTQLWLRHFLQLLVQAAATFYLILLTLPSNQLLGPTLLLFIVGIVKYSERCVSLCLACRREIGKWVLSSTEFEKLVLFDMSSAAASIFVRPLGGSLRVGKLSFSFTVNEHTIVSEALKFRQGTDNEDLKSYTGATDALRITEVVMNMIYENVFSKALVLHCGGWGYAFRFLTFSSTVAALSIFCFKEHHHYYYNNGRGNDVGVTYVLLGSAVVLELYSILMIIFSDWTFAHIRPKNNNNNNKFIRCVQRCCAFVFLPALRKLVRLKMTKWDDNDRGRRCGAYVFRRWSGHVSGYNLTRISSAQKATTTPENTSNNNNNINVVSKVRAATIKPFAVAKDKFFKAEYDEWKYVSHEPLTDPLWRFVFDHLRAKIKQQPKPPNFRLLSGGFLALKPQKTTRSNNNNNNHDVMGVIGDPFIDLLVEDFNYGRNLLIWSIATDLLYNNAYDDNDISISIRSSNNNNSNGSGNNSNAKYCSKILSDYMLYLLVVRQLWPLGDFKRQFMELCGDYHERKGGVKDDILRPDVIDLDGASTKLFDCGDKLARILKKLAGERMGEGGGEEAMWEVVGSVWVEKLWLGARKCTANTHIELLSRGGELLTLVWLLSTKLEYV
ncbi:hypothetical protein DM860_016455 [Cuscuta australis]|uniref:DUF4220 domain-containing protein n=1 Tax=Cuscuta australis TaxID=267555 RepID=A0A328DIT1_9ASTE|nr:hypothetical protein DM860_016455 [Cuscuta australis]